jgi:hypothetical protein
MTAKYNGILAWRFNLYCHSPTSTCDIVGQHNKIGGINLGVTLVLQRRISKEVGVEIHAERNM